VSEYKNITLILIIIKIIIIIIIAKGFS